MLLPSHDRDLYCTTSFLDANPNLHINFHTSGDQHLDENSNGDQHTDIYRNLYSYAIQDPNAGTFKHCEFHASERLPGESGA
jgi:hypothetical protein